MDIFFALTSLSGLIALGILTVYDFKHMILPNLWVVIFAIIGIVHHTLQNWSMITPLDAFLGLLVGGGFLLLIRAFANWRYKKNTLGLGDVKLMMAGGIWLGFPHILLAISIGAFFSVFLALIYIGIFKKLIQKQDVSLRGTKLPAGPGFIIGIIVIFIWFHQGIF